MSNTKQIQVTIPHKTYKAMVAVFNLNNKDDLDKLVQNLVDDELHRQLEIN